MGGSAVLDTSGDSAQFAVGTVDLTKKPGSHMSYLMRSVGSFSTMTWSMMLVESQPLAIPVSHDFDFPFAFVAFSLSTKSLIMLCRSPFLLASSRTSSVVMVDRPAWRLKLSRSTATFSDYPLIMGETC